MLEEKDLSVETLTIASPDGKPRMVLTTDLATGMPIFRFLDKFAIERLVIRLGPSGSPEIILLRHNGTIAVLI
jgi:hypothetical protein